MKVKCRGYEGELTYLEVMERFRNANRELVNVYKVRISPDKNTIIKLSNVKEKEIEIQKSVTLSVDGAEIAMAINRPLIRSNTDVKPTVDRRCFCAE